MWGYENEVRQVAVQALCRLNRDPASKSCGSFDRYWWGWKSRDFPDSTLQAAISLLLNTSGKEGWDWMMPGIIQSYVSFLERIQHTDGSFDQCYPFEKAPGVFYDILPSLIEVYRSPWTDEITRNRVGHLIKKGLIFSLAQDETHGEIVNHLAHFAYGLLLHWKVFGDLDSRDRANYYLARILKNFDADEGWFQEYHGPDPGYQTRTLAYLTRAAELLNDHSLWDICAKAARFIELMLMPDGSLHPMLGVRSTALLYPSGFERLAAHDRKFMPLAQRIRSAWKNNAVPLPSQLDFVNALRLGEDAWHAVELASLTGCNSIESCEDLSFIPSGITNLKHAGVIIYRDMDFIAWCGWRLGGAVIVWRRSPGETWHLAYEDAGYLIDGSGADGQWLSRMPDAGKLIELHHDRLIMEAAFYQVLHEEVTPPKLLLLRFLNLTVLRWQLIGDIFRRVLVHRLAYKGDPLNAFLRREIVFSLGRIVIVDQFNNTEKITESLANAPLRRYRRMTGIHMASSRYYQPIEGRRLSVKTEIEPASLNIASQIRTEIDALKTTND